MNTVTKKYEVIRNEVILGTTFNMGEYTHKKKVTWEVRLINPKDGLGEIHLNYMVFKLKKTAMYVCNGLNKFYNEENIYKASYEDEYKRIFKVIGNIVMKEFRRNLKEYWESFD